MAISKINVVKVVNSGATAKKANQKVVSIKNGIDDVSWRLDEKIKKRNNIGIRLNTLSKNLDIIEHNILKLVNAVETSANGYQQADKRILNAAEDLFKDNNSITPVISVPVPLSPDFSGNHPHFTEDAIGIVEERPDDVKDFLWAILENIPIFGAFPHAIGTLFSMNEFKEIMSEYLALNNGNLMGMKHSQRVQWKVIDLMINNIPGVNAVWAIYYNALDENLKKNMPKPQKLN